ncbi:BCCT family transporter [Pseudactinotalea sp. Z1739]|uniref:BCCT family transporter n=1 Tax=Pseudactinotalea sp. Z1739 TaxID=3413028 RepID=UPI003C7E73F1
MSTSPPSTVGGEPEIQAPVHDPDRPWYTSVQPRVFLPAMGIILAFVLWAVLAPLSAGETLGNVREVVIQGVGWYYALVVTAFVVFSLWVGLSHYGDIKLGRDDEKAEFTLPTWLAMLFAAGMGIGLVFWGVAEPLNHFADTASYPIFGAPEDNPAEAAEASLAVTFLHWGLHPWAIYVVVGLAVAYAVHVKRRPISLRWTLQPLLGDRVRGWTGDAIDVIAVVGTIFGVATSLGLGVMQIAAGLTFLDVLDADSSLALVYVVLIGIITAAAIVSVVTGVKKGIKWLSRINMGMALGLLTFVFVFGPTLFFLRQYIEGIGAYVASFIDLSFNTAASIGPAALEWQGWWTAFYWGWWISWAPFVGVFIARISRGRTVREFVLGVLLVPALFSILWFTVLGGGAVLRERLEGGLVTDGAVDTEGVLFTFLQGFPGGTVVAGLVILLITLFFITSSDSGSLVVDMLASGGMVEPPSWSRVLWSVIEGIVAMALLLAGLAAAAGDPELEESALGALQDVAIIIALPFSVVMILMVFSIVREFRAQREQTLRVQRRMVRRELAQEVSETLLEEGLVNAPRSRRFGRRRGADRPEF